MWQVNNQTPFPAEGRFQRDGQGTSFWCVWVACTFQLRAGKMPLFLPQQHPPLQAPLYHNDDPEDALLLDADITPLREKVDVIVMGAVDRPPADAGPKAVLARIGAWEKRIWVQPSQQWGRNGKPEALAPEALASEAPEQIALNYREAFGGPGFADNPLGQGHGDRDGKGRPVALTPTAAAQTGPGHSMGVAGFGAVPRGWPRRARLGGTYDLAWQSERAPLLPQDFDPAYWQAAPADQQLPRVGLTGLADGAEVHLGGFAGCGPADAPTGFRLPAPDIQTSTRIAGRWQGAQTQLQSVVIDTDTLLVRMCYQAAWPVAGTAADVTVDVAAVMMGSARGFRVRPQDAAAFHRSRTLPEVTT